MPVTRGWRPGLFWLCLLGVLVLSLLPGTQTLPSTGWDKSNHALAFVALFLLGDAAYPRNAASIALSLLAFGGLIEILQSMTGYRFAEWADLLADGVGLLIGCLLAQLKSGFCGAPANQSVNSASNDDSRNDRGVPHG